jgi:hypothetical protein
MRSSGESGLLAESLLETHPGRVPLASHRHAKGRGLIFGASNELMDYRELLKKYIAHVAYYEGISFLRDMDRDASLFTDEEWAELKRLDTPDNTENSSHPE